ncbi:WDY protein, partial [Acromyrmex heyeri]
FLWKDFYGRAKRAVRNQILPFLLLFVCGHTWGMTSLQIISNARVIVSDSADPTIRLWSLMNLKIRLLPTVVPNATQITSNFMTNSIYDTYVILRENIEFRQKSYQEELEIKANESLHEQIGESNNSSKFKLA